ncbi:hypothetical protein Baya_12086 [Bagarius yarrelli]|uniref:Uncharacterized protein n=1 Tax=Bagarius yarrelli TaxID=175774 RepID=A0A556V2N8_BAGYA|nr:hypothetical protein Baya_12086 [Bagarius yarrelli]
MLPHPHSPSGNFLRQAAPWILIFSQISTWASRANQRCDDVTRRAAVIVLKQELLKRRLVTSEMTMKPEWGAKVHPKLSSTWGAVGGSEVEMRCLRFASLRGRLVFVNALSCYSQIHRQCRFVRLQVFRDMLGHVLQRTAL